MRDLLSRFRKSKAFKLTFFEYILIGFILFVAARIGARIIVGKLWRL